MGFGIFSRFSYFSRFSRRFVFLFHFALLGAGFLSAVPAMAAKGGQKGSQKVTAKGATAKGATAKGVTAKEVMLKVDQQSKKHKTQKMEVYMSIRNGGGGKKTRYFNLSKLIEDKGNHSLIKFYRPAEVKGTGVLTESKGGSASAQQWVYFPAFRSVKKLRTEKQNDSFMGSDFSYSDVAGRQVDQDSHTFFKSEDDKYYYIQSVPKDSKDAYSKLEIKVYKSIHIPTEVRFYNKKGKKLKTLSNKKINKVEGMYIVVHSIMENHLSKGRTELKIEPKKIKLGISLSKGDVGLRALKSI